MQINKWPNHPVKTDLEERKKLNIFSHLSSDSTEHPFSDWRQSWRREESVCRRKTQSLFVFSRLLQHFHSQLLHFTTQPREGSISPPLNVCRQLHWRCSILQPDLLPPVRLELCTSDALIVFPTRPFKVLHKGPSTAAATTLQLCHYCLVGSDWRDGALQQSHAAAGGWDQT